MSRSTRSDGPVELTVHGQARTGPAAANVVLRQGTRRLDRCRGPEFPNYYYFGGADG